MDTNYDFSKSIVPGNEQYTTAVSQEEYMRAYKLTAKTSKKTIIWFTVTILTISFILLPFESYITIYVLIFGLIYEICFLIRYFCIYKSWKDKSLQLENKLYVNDIFEDKISISVLKNHELIKKTSVSFDNINYIDENEELFVFSDSVHMFNINKSVLRDDSILYNKFKEVTEKTKINRKLFLTGAIFAYLSVLFIVFIKVGLDTFSLYLGNPCFWLYFVALPFPVVCIIYSFILKRKKLKFAPYLIVGIVVSLFLIINGLEQIEYNKYYDSGYNVIAETEEKIGIEIPTPDYIEFYKDTYSEDNRIKIINEVNMEFIELEYIETDINYTEKLVTYDVWKKGLPKEFLNIIPYPDYFKESEYSILYNVDTGKINTVPTENGTHRLVIIAYYFGSIDIIEYTITL